MSNSLTNSQLIGNRAQTPVNSAEFFVPVPRPRALRQHVIGSLLRAIFQGQLCDGNPLNAQRLAEQFGVSATPVREALVELATIGIVETRHNRGTVVRSFGPVQLRDIYHLRRVLETEATWCACGKIPHEALEKLKQEMTELLNNKQVVNWSERAVTADRQLHELITNNCGSQRLAEEIKRYNTLIQCIRDVVGNRSYAQEKALLQHLEIIHALLEEQPDLAAVAMKRHIQSTAESVRQALFPGSEHTTQNTSPESAKSFSTRRD